MLSHRELSSQVNEMSLNDDIIGHFTVILFAFGCLLLPEHNADLQIEIHTM